MKKIPYVIPLFLVLVIAGACIAGCFEISTGDEAAGTTTTPTIAATTASVLYSAGDVVTNPKSSTGTGLLIVGYNAATDMYERAYIYPNADGSWGYRMDTKTDKISRSVVEKVYTEKAGTFEVSAVPVRTPVGDTTPVVTTLASSSGSLTTVPTTTTSSTELIPKVKDIDPFIGTAGKTVTISELSGENFVTGANVTLEKSGETPINATDVSVKTSTKITCTFVLPSGTAAGQWDVVVTNPNGKSNKYTSLFTIYKSGSESATTTTTTTTTTTAVAGNVTFVSLSPNVFTTGGAEGYATVQIVGSNLGFPVANIKLVKGGSTITSSSYYASSSGSSQASFTIPAGSQGTWTVTAIDSSGTVLGTLTDGFIIQ